MTRTTSSAAFLGAHAFANLALDLQNLVTRQDKGLLQPLNLLSQLGLSQLHLGDGRSSAAE